MNNPFRGSVGKIVLGVTDQGVFSGANMMLGVVAAQRLTPSAFGQFSLAVTVLTIAQGLVRSRRGELVGIVRLSKANQAHAYASAQKFALTVGVALGTFGSLWIWLIGGASSTAFLVLATAPAILFADVTRYIGFSKGRPDQVLLLDLVWLVAQGLPLLLMSDPEAAVGLAWGVGASAALGLGLALQLSPNPFAFGRRRPGSDDGLSDGNKFAVEFLLGLLPVHALILIFSAIYGAGVAGDYRGAQILLGPINILHGGVMAMLGPLVRSTIGSRRQFALGRFVAMGLVALGAAWLAVLHIYGGQIGSVVLGEQAGGSLAALHGLGLERVALGILIPVVVLFRYEGWLRKLIFLRAVSAATIMGIGILTFQAAGLSGVGYLAALVHAGMAAVGISKLRAKHPAERLQSRRQ